MAGGSYRKKFRQALKGGQKQNLYISHFLHSFLFNAEPWQAHFVTNMFIRPTAEELANYGEPDFVCFNASKAKVDNYKELLL